MAEQDTVAVLQAVEPIRGALAADGYELQVADGDTGVVLRIVAGPEACADCLVPPAVMEPMIGELLNQADVHVGWALEYP